jgi:competence protein ComEC
LIAVFVWVTIAKSPSDGAVHVFFLSVGQGDSELIQKGNYQILIDGGPDDKVLQEIGKVMPLTDRKIETVILTHPHADHLAGLNQILDRYEIGTIYSGGALYTTNGYLEFLGKIKDKKIDYQIPEVGQELKPYDNASLKFLWPGKQYQEKTVENSNNTSEVAKFCYFDHCALFTGDIETDEQAKMFDHYSSSPPVGGPLSEGTGSSSTLTDAEASNNNFFESELLKIPHHGSTNGINQLLLEKVKPKYAIIEVGTDNKFGHPHTVVLDLLKTVNINTFRTDRDGTIEFVFNQSGIVKK